MKKLFVLLFAFVALQVGVTTDARAQRIDFRKLGLMLPDYERNARLYYGDTKERALAVLGSPTRTGTHWSEIDEKTIEEWYYGTSELYFLDGVLDDYVLNDRSLLVGEDFSKSYGVGSFMGTKAPGEPGVMYGVMKKGQTVTNLRPIEGDPNNPAPVADWFYGYNITKRPGTAHNIPYSIASVNYLIVNGVDYDAAFVALFDSNKQIINIYLGD